ncbi:hypothetical protein EVAR_13551_1 [Eumeta japonica]|uniref:Uncharacterized protein n=1 Tax=Eumeta variegata TaxID=151549 RepID=A0A4C1U9J2_EUMVA|nr:hypothetical protein EVAR_13551_1 [Eumeta japonica]
MKNNSDRFSVIARSRKQVARPHASRARCDPPISARRSPSSRHLAPINAHCIIETDTPFCVGDWSDSGAVIARPAASADENAPDRIFNDAHIDQP